ncbi:restriction endonuclease subunit S [Lactobacillus iners]|uniref:restriction endonuclease subunit S n=1 Tax=Lactobacillus iners TaxID=147802 RepID=UPI0036F4856B
MSILLLRCQENDCSGSSFAITPSTAKDDLIINDNLAAMIKTIYEYWFIQFEFPDENGKPYKSSGGKMVWNEQLKRTIPQGWSVESIINTPLCYPIKPGIKPFSEKTYLATADVIGTSIGTGNPINYETRESRANMQPEINSVWFAKMKSSIKHLFLSSSMHDFIHSSILSTGFQGLQCTERSFEYIASFIGNDYFETLKDQLAHGATQEAVNNDDLKGVKILIPDNRTLDLYHSASRQNYQLIGSALIENKHLESLRDWLLPMLMNGQATIED